MEGAKVLSTVSGARGSFDGEFVNKCGIWSILRITTDQFLGREANFVTEAVSTMESLYNSYGDVQEQLCCPIATETPVR